MVGKNFKIYLFILGLLFLISFIFLLARFVYNLGYEKGSGVTRMDKTIMVLLNDEGKSYVLEEDKVFLTVSKSLRPMFIIRRNEEISNLKIYFDDSQHDLLSSNIPSANIEYNKDLKIVFNYTLDPQEHKIVLQYTKDDREITEQYKFLLILFDDFSGSLSQSKLWGMADSAKRYNNWEIKDGKLIANTLPPEASPNDISSLFFIRRFQGDFFVKFDFVPKTNNISFLPYLFQRDLNFVFGDNSNRDVTIHNKPETRSSFLFDPMKTYHVVLTRNHNIYRLYVTDKEVFHENNLLIIYEDKEQLKVPFDAFGFAIWSSSGGVVIDNFYTANRDISNNLNFK